VCVLGTGYDGDYPFKASYLHTGEGEGFRSVSSDGSWDYLDVLLEGFQPNDSETSPSLKVTIVVPKSWDTPLVLALLVHYLRGEDTLRIHRPSGRIRDVFDWFVQEPHAIGNYLSKEDVYSAIEVWNGTA
jgi:hypothetical protein